MNPIFVAIDTPDLAEAEALANAVREHVGGVKLGLEFYSAQGPEGVRKIAALGLPIFLDLKLHDIPNTVAKSVSALAPLKPAILTVHAAGGHEMLWEAKRAAPANTKVVAVTLLTSLDAGDLGDLGIQRSPADQVAPLRKAISAASAAASLSATMPAKPPSRTIAMRPETAHAAASSSAISLAPETSGRSTRPWMSPGSA